MSNIKRTIRIEELILDDIKSIALQEGQSENQVIEQALKFYRDYYYMQNKSSFLNEQILSIIQSTCAALERSINSKTNKLLHELTIQSSIQNYILCENLEIGANDLHLYRIKALEHLKNTGRSVRVDEIYHE